MSETLGLTAEAIREARTPKGEPRVSQRELAERLGLADPSSVSKWERGEVLPETPTVIRIEEALDLKPGSLLTVRNDEWELIHGPVESPKALYERKLFRNRDRLSDEQLREVAEFVDRLLAKDPPRDGGQRR